MWTHEMITCSSVSTKKSIEICSACKFCTTEGMTACRDLGVRSHFCLHCLPPRNTFPKHGKAPSRRLQSLANQSGHLKRPNDSHLTRSSSERTASRAVPPDGAHVLKVKYADKEFTLESGEIGRQANGAVIIRDGETALYTTACCDNEPATAGSFAPFSVNYTERFSAAGRTSGSYFRREGRASLHEMLTSRFTDRPIRPMMPKGWQNDTQILSWLMSYDGERQAEPLAMTSAAAALAISDIPLSKVVAGVRVGLKGDMPIINPTVEEQSASVLDLTMAGTADAILMIEGFCNFLTDAQMLKALEAGSKAISEICQQIQSWADKIGKPKRQDLVEADLSFDEELSNSNLASEIRELFLKQLGKQERGEAVAQLKSAAVDAILEKQGSGSDDTELRKRVKSAAQRLEAKVMRDLIIQDGKRVDGRGLTDVRAIASRCGLLPRAHGSALFTRGETQALAVTTLGSVDMMLRHDSVGGDEEADKRFYLQYNFPPSCVGETGRVGPVGRREAGHGMLAERALQPIIPPEEEFPYVIRTESTITGSNGSSSMASVCGGCLSLMDAGVPIKREVAGVAMGLVLTEDGGYKILTDILGSEDALGDMDFKVAGDGEHITAFQMDIKLHQVEGISLEIMADALAQARIARQHILKEMAECRPAPKRELGPYTSRISRVFVSPRHVGQIIGSGGKTIRGLQDSTGAQIKLVGDGSEGSFEVSASDWQMVEKAKTAILQIIEEPEVGKTYRSCRVTGVEKYGLFVEFLPGRDGLLHISELAQDEALGDFQVDDKLDVILAEVDGAKCRLSRHLSGNGSGSEQETSPSYERPVRKPSGANAAQAKPSVTPGSLFRGARVLESKPYGIFVEVEPGVRGLVHTTELYKAGETKQVFQHGDTVDVVCLPDREPGKLRFSRKQVDEVPGETAPAA